MLGQQLGGGVSAGLENVINNRINRMHQQEQHKMQLEQQQAEQQRLAPFAAALGYPGAEVLGNTGLSNLVLGQQRGANALDLLHQKQAMEQEKLSNIRNLMEQKTPYQNIEPTQATSEQIPSEIKQKEPGIENEMPDFDVQRKNIENEWAQKNKVAEGISLSGDRIIGKQLADEAAKTRESGLSQIQHAQDLWEKKNQQSWERQKEDYGIFQPYLEAEAKEKQEQQTLDLSERAILNGDYKDATTGTWIKKMLGNDLYALWESGDMKALKNLRAKGMANLKSNFGPSISDSDVRNIFETLISPTNTMDANLAVLKIQRAQLGEAAMKADIARNVWEKYPKLSPWQKKTKVEAEFNKQLDGYYTRKLNEAYPQNVQNLTLHRGKPISYEEATKTNNPEQKYEDPITGDIIKIVNGKEVVVQKGKKKSVGV